MTVWIIIAVLLCLTALVAALAYICFRMAFYSPERVPEDPNVAAIPEGEIYEPWRESMERWDRLVCKMPHEDVEISSFDGLRLKGRYYEHVPGAPIELMFHGYRGTARRDLSGGVLRCFELGRNALMVEQRASGASEGHVISFGINEHRDCLAWVDFAVEHFGADVKIILTGISMGAATVMLAADKELPENVIGILADCGYTSAREIIAKVVKEMGLPPKLCLPFIKLGAKLFGHFDLDECSPLEALRHSRLPVIFFHGDADDYVPWEMSRRNFDACTSRKKFVLIPDAGHGLAFPVSPEIYLNSLREFFGTEASGESKSE